MPKLTIELIPKTCWFSSVRTMVSASNWNKIRKISYELAKNKCQICGDNGINQGYKHPVECHEIWEYDDINHIQRLIGLISLCVKCHQVKHIGRTIAMGKEQPLFKHIMKINKWTKAKLENYIQECFIIHKERSKYKWELDISILKDEPFNINIKDKPRIFKPKKYKKKRKNKKPKLTKKTTRPKRIR